MIKRNKRNIGKIVKVVIPESAKPTSMGRTLNGRIGKVVGFRGNLQYRIPGVRQAIPYVWVAIKNLHDDKFNGAYPIGGNYLVVS